MSRFVSSFNVDFCQVLNVELPELVPARIWKELDKHRKYPNAIKRYLKKNFGASFSIKYAKHVSVAGEFDDEKEIIKVDAIAPRKMNDQQWEELKSEIIITMMHEYIHHMQYICAGDIPDLVLLHKESSNKSIEENREYYSTWIEIQAYAHCILCEFKNNNLNKTCLNQIRSKRCVSPTLSRFRKAFDGFDYPMRYLYREILRWERRYENLNNR